MDRKLGHLVDLISEMKKQGASDQMIKSNFSRYIEIKAREQKTPLHGQFELTPYCNLDCKMCYIHLNESQFNKNQLIKVEVWKTLIDEAHRAGMIYTSLTGGECLTYPGFDEIYFYLLEKGIVPNIQTNGLLLDKERIEFFKKFPPNRIQVTLYGSSDDAYAIVTGHKVFNTVYHNIELLRDAQIKASLVLTPSAYMREDMQSLVETARSLRIPYGINASLITPRDATGRQLQDLEIEQYIEMYRILKEIEQEDLYPIDPAELPIENQQGNPTYGLQCGGGTSAFVIQYNGKMSPCPSLWEVTTEPLQEGFLNAWAHLNDLVSKYPMPAECENCVYHKFCMNCPAIHNNAHNPGHCDTRICERTKRLVQEGFIKLSEL